MLRLSSAGEKEVATRDIVVLKFYDEEMLNFRAGSNALTKYVISQDNKVRGMAAVAMEFLATDEAATSFSTPVRFQ
ncbi:hypothetical protein QYF36_017470 [Acer negundo]|nr:hypothetical protein QYF36_017470 [Acer negundo]